MIRLLKITRQFAKTNNLRKPFAKNDLNLLKSAFEVQKYPMDHELDALAVETGRDVKSIYNWFNRERTKYRKNNTENKTESPNKKIYKKDQLTILDRDGPTRGTRRSWDLKTPTRGVGI